mmetsp:Transcript_35927/g.76280  ORF Transcript_35927/g.76280 Transcript_35927/m.76280 type:complete len:214 (+) Transcript_35927:23-664(+)
MEPVVVGEAPDYGDVMYWDTRFALDPEPFEWYLPWEELREVVIPRLLALGVPPQDVEVLVVGCGNSTVPEELYLEGWENITAIDTSSVVVEQMRTRCVKFPELEFQVMDACALQYPDSSFHVIMDKGCLDTVLCEAEDPLAAASAVVGEAHRTLAVPGVYLLLSHGPASSRLEYLTAGDPRWRVEAVRLRKDEAVGDGDEAFYFLYICTKVGE